MDYFGKYVIWTEHERGIIATAICCDGRLSDGIRKAKENAIIKGYAFVKIWWTPVANKG